VPGIGPVGAANLIQEFGDLETIFAHLDDIKRQGIRERLREHMDLARLSKELGRIKCDTPLPEPELDLSWKQPQALEARKLFARLEFGRGDGGGPGGAVRAGPEGGASGAGPGDR